MNEDVYRRLARRLDAIPSGFPATESGVELLLLEWLYTPQEAALAAVMRLRREPAAAIAARAGVAPEVARSLLERMAGKGLVSASGNRRSQSFGLRPFMVGIYEAQLDRMDAEIAALFEQYYQETSAGLVRDPPALQRIIPVESAILPELEVCSYERAGALVERAHSWAVRDCICRVQRRLIGKGCDHPVETCLTFAPVRGVYKDSRQARAISKGEALYILRQANEAGLVHTLGNYRHGNSYICNCCTCCCKVLRGLAEFGRQAAVARSRFCALVEADLCIGCGECYDRCPFGALSAADDVPSIDGARCVGCGLCVTVCPMNALRLAERAGDEIVLPPNNSEEWREQRARARGISLAEIA
jgi:ferredoxin